MGTKKPKILFIGPTPPPYSGPELSMQQFLESNILNEAFHIQFLKTNFRTDNTNKGKFGTSMILNFFKFFSKLLKLLIVFRPACVYYPITPTQIGWIGRDVWTILLAKFFGAKVIIHLRGSHFKLNFQMFHRIVKRLIGWTLKRVDKAIVQARYLEDQFLPYIERKNVEVLYQAMDIEEFPFGSKEQIKKNRILVIGHMTKAKGYTDILKIIPEIVKEFPNVSFNFAGNMRKGERGVFYNQYTGEKIQYEDPVEAEKIILNGNSAKNYNNLGIIKGDEKLKQLQMADVFLTASYSEGFSRALLEAMSVGKPIIYTPVGAHREVFNDSHGISFIPGDLEQLKKAIQEMLRKDNKIEIGKRNRNYVFENFSIDKIVNNFKNIINKTVQ
ncbi:MAG: glycosyltransferase family 4 protein [Flavobacteriaceae bacterium]